MTLFLDAGDITSLADNAVVTAAARTAVEAERDGSAVLPPRQDVRLDTGLLRVMPAALKDVMGLKVMTLVKGLGTRYLLLVYDRATSALVGLLDAEEITKLRTAATTALAAQILQPEPQRELGLVGTGFEAGGHLSAFADLWPLESVRVFSPSHERREAFAERASARLGIDVRATDSAGAACAFGSTVVLATKSETPVVVGADFPPGHVVLSIGSTRPDLRELDRATLARTAALLVDDPVQVGLESGDIIDALGSGALTPEHVVGMGQALDADPPERSAARDLLTFKSVGTALQDLALATAALDAAARAGVGRELGELTRLKPFAASSPPEVTASSPGRSSA